MALGALRQGRFHNIGPSFVVRSLGVIQGRFRVCVPSTVYVGYIHILPQKVQSTRIGLGIRAYRSPKKAHTLNPKPQPRVDERHLMASAANRIDLLEPK